MNAIKFRSRLGQFCQRGPHLLWLLLTVASSNALTATIAAAQYPSKPIRLIVPFSPGGGTDLLARLIGQRLSEALAQPVVIDNRAGAGGNLGIELTARAPGDGYTLVLVAGSFAIIPSLYHKLDYDPVRDFAPVGLVATIPYVIVSTPKLPAQTLKEFIALARAKPGQLNYGSGGSGTSGHLAAELFKISADINLLHVPYKGSVPAMTDVISGQLQLLFIGISASAPHIKTGRLRGLAIVAPQRSAVLPDVPTVGEAGLPGFDVTTWYGMLAPAATPAGIVQRLNRELTRIIQSPDTRERLAVLGADPATNSPAEFSSFIKQEIAKWHKAVQAAGLQAN
ncbi:MAG: tripartite tricarboxylate transporter substrate binding protein [Betaproteobacteria bacterium]|nr:tripartite tricarboxylate transporter substrate binding protein [Betaproteobacteria bacterium]